MRPINELLDRKELPIYREGSNRPHTSQSTIIFLLATVILFMSSVTFGSIGEKEISLAILPFGVLFIICSLSSLYVDGKKTREFDGDTESETILMVKSWASRRYGLDLVDEDAYRIARAFNGEKLFLSDDQVVIVDIKDSKLRLVKDQVIELPRLT